VRVTAGSREEPGRKPVTRDSNNNNIIHSNNNRVNIPLVCVQYHDHSYWRNEPGIRRRRVKKGMRVNRFGKIVVSDKNVWATLSA
jgi:hypothetical protein